MRGKSHCCLGQFLVHNYMENVSSLHRQAFLLGCIEPDRNPATYLKGSIRYQWLRGHNFLNAKRYMHRIARRLENKQYLSLFDYYTLGKLIHYTTDAFTYAHNDMFTTDLGEHMEYEVALQEHFLAYMADAAKPELPPFRSIMDSICSYHQEYRVLPASIHTDTKFALKACCCVLAILFIKPI